MAEHMAPTVLANKVPEVRAKTHVRDSRLVVSPLLNREALEEDESLAVEEVGAEFVQAGG